MNTKQTVKITWAALASVIELDSAQVTTHPPLTHAQILTARPVCEKADTERMRNNVVEDTNCDRDNEWQVI